MTNYLKVFLKVFEAREEFFPANPSREYGLNSTKRNESPTDLRRKMHKYKNIFRVNFENLKKILDFSFFSANSCFEIARSLEKLGSAESLYAPS